MSRRKDLLGWIVLRERRTLWGWALVTLPHEIRVDNFHGPLHIHPPRGRGPPEPIAERTLEDIRRIVRRHAEALGTVVYTELLEELR